MLENGPSMRGADIGCINTGGCCKSCVYDLLADGRKSPSHSSSPSTSRILGNLVDEHEEPKVCVSRRGGGVDGPKENGMEPPSSQFNPNVVSDHAESKLYMRIISFFRNKAAGSGSELGGRKICPVPKTWWLWQFFLVCARVSRAIGSSQGTIGIGSLRSGSLSNMPRDIEIWANTRQCNRQ